MDVVTGCRKSESVPDSARAVSKNESRRRLPVAWRGLSLPTATIHFEPFAKVENDRSERAREFQKRREEVPALNLASASEELRTLLLANRDRIAVRTNALAWEKQLADWEAQAPAVRLAVKDREPSTDRIWRVPSSETAEVELETTPSDAALARIEWIALTPEFSRCNLTATRADEIGFAQGAPPRPRWRENRLPGTGSTLSLDVAHRRRLRRVWAMRVKARIEIAGRIRERRP